MPRSRSWPYCYALLLPALALLSCKKNVASKAASTESEGQSCNATASSVVPNRNIAAAASAPASPFTKEVVLALQQDRFTLVRPANDAGDIETVQFSRPTEIAEIVIEIEAGTRDLCAVQTLAQSSFVAGDPGGLTFQNDQVKWETLGSLQRLTYRPQGNIVPVASLKFSRGPSADPASRRTAVKSIRIYAKPGKDEPESSLAISDTHFHPCSFSHHCAPLARVVEEMDRSGLKNAAVFGLQHTLVAGASPWATGENGIEDVPFHYADQAALPSTLQHSPAANERTKTSYDAWSVSPTIYADLNNLLDYETLSAEQKTRLHPYASGFRIEAFEGGSAPRERLEYDACTQDGGESLNLLYAKALDALFPAAVKGYAEYNLNKVVLFKHDAFAPAVSGSVLACWKPFMDYVAETGRPIGFHDDLANAQDGQHGFAKLMEVAKTFPKATIVWLHAGASPEATPAFSGAAHVKQMRDFLATSPGKRYVELSWPNGFFRAFEDACPVAQGGVQGAACRTSLAAYVNFFNENADKLLFGSDQVSLFYPEYIGKATGETFVNHLSYLEGLTLPATIRTQLGYLIDMEAAAGVKLAPDTRKKMLNDNFESLQAKATSTIRKGPLMDKARAKSVVVSLLERNERELEKISSLIRSKKAGSPVPGLKDSRYAEMKERFLTRFGK